MIRNTALTYCNLSKLFTLNNQFKCLQIITTSHTPPLQPNQRLCSTTSSTATVTNNNQHPIGKKYYSKFNGPDELDDVNLDDIKIADVNIKKELKDNYTEMPPPEKLVQFIRTTFPNCSTERAWKIVDGEPGLRRNYAKNLSIVAKYMIENGVKEEIILDNPIILINSYKMITLKIALLKKMHPRNINDVILLAKTTLKQLNKIVAICNLETKRGQNRIYFLSKQLKLEPHIVTKHLSTHLFMFELPIENMKRNLNIMQEYNVASINIIRDPWAFRYSPRSIKERLEWAVLGQKDKLMPWMVRCPPSVLAKSIQNSVEAKKLLGDNTLVEYISERLNFDVTTMKHILDKHPSTYSVRVMKIKEILDFLLNEAGFTRNDIAMTPRILCHSLDTTKQRLEQLKELGCNITSLVILCRSANEYQKFINNWEATRIMLMKRKVIPST